MKINKIIVKYLCIGLFFLLGSNVIAKVHTNASTHSSESGWLIGGGLGSYSMETKITTLSNTFTSTGSSTGLNLKSGYSFQFPKNYINIYVSLTTLSDGEVKYNDINIPGHKIEVENHSGLAGDFGFYVSPKASLYFTLGLAQVYVDYNYRSSSGSLRHASPSELGLLYGVGFGYKVTDHVNVNLGYTTNTSKRKAEFLLRQLPEVETTIDGIKLSTSYKY